MVVGKLPPRRVVPVVQDVKQFGSNDDVLDRFESLLHLGQFFFQPVTFNDVHGVELLELVQQLP
jgi:hypothetical protein